MRFPSPDITPLQKLATLLTACGVLACPLFLHAHGEIGDDIKDLQAHLTEYEEDLMTVMANYKGLVDKYEAGEATNTDDLLKFWEDAKIHYPIELNYIPVYAKIWQNIYGIKEGIDNKKPVEDVRASQIALEHMLWQGLGVVKLAAKVQAEKNAKAEAEGKTTEAMPKEDTSPVATLAVIQDKVDRVMAKCAERDYEAAMEMVHDTYLNLFEGVEGQLIELDAKLVEDLEKDFNVTLPQAIEAEVSIEEVKKVTGAMKEKLTKASDLLAESEKNKKDVF